MKKSILALIVSLVILLATSCIGSVPQVPTQTPDITTPAYTQPVTTPTYTQSPTQTPVVPPDQTPATFKVVKVYGTST